MMTQLILDTDDSISFKSYRKYSSESEFICFSFLNFFYRNNNNNNNNTINANTKLVQHSTQRTVMSMNNMCVQPNVIGQKVITGKNTTASGKYMAQSNPNMSNIGQTSCMSTTATPYRSLDPMHGNDQRVTTTYRAIQPSSETRQTSVTKTITMLNHPMNANTENNCQQAAKKETEWNQLYVTNSYIHTHTTHLDCI